MNENSPPGDFAHDIKDGIRQGIDWIVLGTRMVLDRKSLWFGMTAVYFVFAFLLKLIPFMGDLLLILITPMLLAGVVRGRAQEGHSGQTGEAGAAPTPFQAWIAGPVQELLRIFTQEEEHTREGTPADLGTNKAFDAVLLGIITLGLAMLVKITGYLLIGGSMVSGLAASQMSTPQPGTLFGMLVVAVLYAILAMALIYSVPLTVLGNRQPLAAISDSFSLCRKNAPALLTLTAPFFIVYLVILAAFAEHRGLGYLLVLSVGFVTLPLFIASAFSSYLKLFPSLPPAARR
jgi:hypothetical protein